eukprot:TRINITY_DN27787_c0_g1_i1.p1 TRINITY_DN27787_c0_g1~~TRINITY_DN27787_c0_g1_i1.p1  ORF type:complete len:325 (+),score=44.53 TRINITY_DN27787_c0_g1_i1:41-1015(+)
MATAERVLEALAQVNAAVPSVLHEDVSSPQNTPARRRAACLASIHTLREAVEALPTSPPRSPAAVPAADPITYSFRMVDSMSLQKPLLLTQSHSSGALLARRESSFTPRRQQTAFDAVEERVDLRSPPLLVTPSEPDTPSAASYHPARGSLSSSGMVSAMGTQPPLLSPRSSFSLAVRHRRACGPLAAARKGAEPGMLPMPRHPGLGASKSAPQLLEHVDGRLAPCSTLPEASSRDSSPRCFLGETATSLPSDGDVLLCAPREGTILYTPPTLFSGSDRFCVEAAPDSPPPAAEPQPPAGSPRALACAANAALGVTSALLLLRA